MPYGNRKTGLGNAEVKSVRWTLFRSWEIPPFFGRSLALWTENGIPCCTNPVVTFKRVSSFFAARESKGAAPVRRLVQKHAGGMFLAPWEIPRIAGCGP